MLKKSHSRASASAISAADGTSIMIPTGSARANATPARSSSSFDSSSSRLAVRSSESAEIIGSSSRTFPVALARSTARSCARNTPSCSSESRIERQPSCGIVLGAIRQARQVLVAPDVERADRHRPRRQHAAHPLVELRLLLLLGEAAVREHQQLGAEQPDPVRAVLLDQPQVGDQADVGGQRDPMPVARLAGALAQGVEVLGRDRVALLRAPVLGDQVLVGREVDLPVAAVHDRDLARLHGGLDPHHAGHGGDLERAGEDRPVRGGAAVLGDDGGDLLDLEPREVPGQDEVRHHDRALGHRIQVVANPEQALHHPAPHVLDVVGALAEVRVLDALEGAPIGAQHVAQREQGIARLLHLGGELRDEALVLEDLDVGMEDRREVGPEARLHVLAGVVELAARLVERLQQVALLARRIGARRVLELREVERGAELVDRADRDSARGRAAAELGPSLAARASRARGPGLRKPRAATPGARAPPRSDPRSRAGGRSSRRARSAARRSGRTARRAAGIGAARASAPRARRS